jgi:NAD(P)-dependent dehydrogenase (short-subunit alcohol dehydrogenase family)
MEFSGLQESMPGYCQGQERNHNLVKNTPQMFILTNADRHWGVYNATKFAVAGLTEALAVEAKSHGVTTTIVYPGYFKTNFLKKGSLRLAKNPIADYKEARELEVIHDTQVIGNQPGDPERAGGVFIALGESKNPPLHFFMGTDSFSMAKGKIETLQHELNANEALSKSTDFVKQAAL